MKAKIVVFLICIIVSYFGCGMKSTDILKVDGGWYFIKDDSLYFEVIFDANKFYSYDENSGDNHGFYKFVGDSLIFYNNYNSRTLAGQVIKVDENNFLLKTSHYSASYHRLLAPINASLILRKDENYVEQYISSYLSRREAWMQHK